jgi:hypothetical protein
VVDPLDPNSVDYAERMERAIHGKRPAATVRRLATGITSDGSPDPNTGPVADAVIEAAKAQRPDDPLWVVLTIQGDPARRLLSEIERRGSAETAARLRVLCGDGLGLPSLRQLRGHLSFPFACVASVGHSDALEPPDAQLHLEWIGALAAAFDEHQRAPDLADALRGLNLHPGEPFCSGRSLAFRDGERQGDALGSVLTIAPVSGTLRCYEPALDGSWRTFDWAGGQWRLSPAPIAPPDSIDAAAHAL